MYPAKNIDDGSSQHTDHCDHVAHSRLQICQTLRLVQAGLSASTVDWDRASVLLRLPGVCAFKHPPLVELSGSGQVKNNGPAGVICGKCLVSPKYQALKSPRLGRMPLLFLKIK
jgi:hypothetical protein